MHKWNLSVQSLVLSTWFDSSHSGNRQEWRRLLTHLSSCHCSVTVRSQKLHHSCHSSRLLADSYNKTLELPFKQDCFLLRPALARPPPHSLSALFFFVAGLQSKERTYLLVQKDLDEFQQELMAASFLGWWAPVQTHPHPTAAPG